MGTKVRDVMTDRPRCVTLETPISEVAQLMESEDIGSLPVLEGDQLAGMITDRDIVVRAVADGDAPNRPVRDLASRDLVTAEPDMSTKDAVDLMGQHQVRRLLVCEGDRLVGVASIGDIAVKEGKDRRVGDTLQEISQGVKEQDEY